ncbi:hypothetical protein AVEN_1393-1 [Araneus ventricosus]|uniref:GAG-pre-integrase domain-containing protein n=1 Tax=Araneus ventricosus TaxID=182803 RepID=A0A4Y2LWW2_ARAVE|nr:hypothetical protein AVEN_1393-1 [Araneus ventricosus]
MNDQQTKLLGKREGKLYKSMLETDENAFLGTYSRRVDDLFTWHKKLAHQNIYQVKYVLKSQGIEYKDSEEFFYEACVLEKQHTFPFERNKNTAKYPGEIIHVDVSGHMEELSIGHARYFLLCKDDYSHYRAVYF